MASTSTWRVALPLAIAWALALAGCPRVPPANLSQDPAELLAQVRAEQARVERVSGSARVRVKSPSLSGSVNEFIAAEKPDRLRVETLDFFGNDAAVLVANGKQFAFYDAQEHVYYRGEPTAENISRLLPIVVPSDELVTILCGSAPILPGRPLSVSSRDGQLLVTIGAGDVGQRLAVGEEAAVEESRVRRMETGPNGQPTEVAPAYDLDFGLFHHLSGVRFPTRVKLEAPVAGVRVELAWKGDLEVNGPARPELFRFAPPKDARVVELKPGATLPPPAPGRPFGE